MSTAGSAEAVSISLHTADVPRSLRPVHTRGDRIFRLGARGVGAFVLVLVGAIGLFLGAQLVPTLHRYGLHFFTENRWIPNRDIVGVSAAILGTVEVAVMALLIAFPLALATALYISEYAPPRLRNFLTLLVDLMAAVPSIVYGVWGYFQLQPYAKLISRWLAEYVGWFPLFQVPGGQPHSASWPKSNFVQSPFIASLVVSMMVVPLACAVMRNVFAQAPLHEREAAMALGATRWGVIRSVVLPFGRAGIVGGTMLGLGRALGETIAVLLILSTSYDLSIHPLHVNGVTLSSFIANGFNEATSGQLSALLAAGFVLFCMTLVVNTLAAMIVNRSRSGATTEI
ncbi:MAG: phosphate transport system permease protein [Frankiaceae bacterium]|jgi:phosphate transport system permease protein|nr:phosphate transport system permease protein [Frankiaceae bacterium]